MAATKPAFTPPGKKGDMIFSALVKLAALIVLLMLGGIIVSPDHLFLGRAFKSLALPFCGPKSGMRLTRSSARWSRFTEPSVTSFIALLIAVPVSFGIALFLTELSPAPAQASAGHCD